MLSLHPTADRMPESSLGRMIGWIMEEFGEGDGLCVADRERVDIPSALAFLHASELPLVSISAASVEEMPDELGLGSRLSSHGHRGRQGAGGGAR